MEIVIRIEHDSDVGVARRSAREAAESAGLNEEDAGRAALVATEAATNLARHASSGAFFVRRLDPAEGHGIEMLAVDRGPGMANLANSMVDGVSTRGTPGQGLGAMKRIADLLTIDSRPGEGTIMVAQVRNGSAPSPLPMAVGGLTAAIVPDGCGDAFAFAAKGQGLAIIMIDGLGHGIDAAVAAEAAVECFHRRSTDDLVNLFQALDRELKPTRGAAIAVAHIDLQDKAVHFMGVGNISGVLVSGGKARNMVSHNGIVGHTMRRVQQFDYPFTDGPTVLLHSDGIGTRWHPMALIERGLAHPTVIAAQLWRSDARGRDDAGIVVARGRA